MYNTATLGNGLRIIHLYSPSPIIYCGYQIAAGSADEDAGREGLAHFVEHMSFKGTRRRSALQVINCLESVGGELNAFTGKDTTVFYAAVEKKHLARAVGVLTDIVFHSGFPQEEIEREAEVICDEIESFNDSPADLIYDEFENVIFKGHPLGHSILGTQETVRSFTSADALSFAGRHYTPANAVFFCSGDADFGRLCRLLKNEDMAGHAGDKGGNRQRGAPVLPAENGGREIVCKTGTHQAHVMIGRCACGINDKRRLPLYLLNNILGGPGMNARLNLALRERNGLVYTVESSMAVFSDTGLWSAYFGCDNKDIDRCRKLMRKELDRLMTRPLPERTLAAAKKQIKGQIALACDNRENFALDFGKSFLHYDLEKDPAALCRDIDALTAGQLQSTAAGIFAAEGLTTLIYT